MTAANNDNGGDNQGGRDGAGKDNDGSPHATLVTTLGTIVIQLLPEAAPKTVANFVNLANSGFYNNLAWHRVGPRICDPDWGPEDEEWRR